MHEMAFSDLHWLNAEGVSGDDFEQLRGYAILSLEGVDKLLTGSGKTPEDIFRAARASQPMAFALPVTARIHVVDQVEDLHSPNVVARLRGSDPELRDEYVVFTAHSDHLGIGEAVNGDNIYKGAIDDASGTACMLEIARAFSRMSPRPRRSLLFVSTTAEEKGMLGSDYFAHYPTVARGSIVADVDIDGDPLLWPMEDVILYSAGHSTLDLQAKEAARHACPLSPPAVFLSQPVLPPRVNPPITHLSTIPPFPPKTLPPPGKPPFFCVLPQNRAPVSPAISLTKSPSFPSLPLSRQIPLW